MRVGFNYRDRRKGQLTVDASSPVEGVSQDGASQLDTDGTLWVGGSRSPPRGLPIEYYLGFEGCIDSIVIDDTSLDMSADRISTSQVEYCELWWHVTLYDHDDDDDDDPISPL